MVYATTTVHWFFAGLMALVPTDEGLKVFAVDARQHRHVAEINRELHEHLPLLAFSKALLPYQDKDEACLDLGGMLPEGTAIDNLARLGLCAFWLDDVDVEILNEPADGSNLGVTRESGRQKFLMRPHRSLPTEASELRDFTWLAEMSWVDWESRQIDPAFLGFIPSRPGVTARFVLPAATVGVCHLASLMEYTEEKIPYFHYQSFERPVFADAPQALADAVRARLEVKGASLRFRLRPHYFSASNIPTIELQGNGIEILVFNLMLPTDDVCDGDMVSAYDFLHFYELASRRPSLRKRYFPQAQLGEATTDVRNNFCGSTLLQDALARFSCDEDFPAGVNNRPACPQVIMQE